MSIAEIMNIIRTRGLTKGNFDELVPEMLRAICEDEYREVVEEFIREFEDIEWNWYPNG